jgi:ketosteroid isomerase-like protein
MADDTQAVLDLEARRCAAIASADFAALSEILADDYLHVFGTGPTTDKTGYIATIKAGPRVPERSNLRVRFYGDSAVVTGDMVNNITMPGEPTRVVQAFCTQVAAKKDGRWQFVSFQLTPKRTASYG